VTRPLSPECRLVFRTADPRCTPADLTPLVSTVSNWQRVAAIADRELATAHLARALHAVGNDVPPALLDDLRRQAQALELRMQYLARRLQHSCAALSERGIPLLLLKGTAVGAIVDPTFCSRPMNDADILVRQEDAGRASEALEASGWTPTPDDVLRDLLIDAQHHHLPPFLDPHMSGIRVELHVSHLPASHPFALDADMLWRDARPVGTPFNGALVPSPEHMLLHAAIHFAWQHPMTFGAWRTFRLVAMVADMTDFTWDRFVTAAVNARASSAAFWTLHLASRLSGLDVPREVLGRLAPPTPAWLMSALERHFIAAIALGEMPPSPSVRVDNLLWLAAIRPRWSGHASTRDWDLENRWGQAYGVASRESTRQRLVRHFSQYRRWTSFLTRTLLGQTGRESAR
jgi:hypothetical protein